MHEVYKCEVYSSLYFYTHIHLCNHHPDQDGAFPPSQKVSLCPSQTVMPSPARWPLFWHLVLLLSFPCSWHSYKWNHTKCTLCVSLSLLNIAYERFIHVILCISSTCIIFHCVTVLKFICSFVGLPTFFSPWIHICWMNMWMFNLIWESS